LIGRFLPSFQRKAKRRVIVSPKFYFFDVGIANYLLKQKSVTAGSEPFGKSFEQFIYLEIYAHSRYTDLNYAIHYWRTTSGIEIDFVLGDGRIAIETKSTSNVQSRHLKGLEQFDTEFSPERLIMVSNDPWPRNIGKVEIIPWALFLEQLWSGELISS
jgi:predicted AAA+ superfamily ATPase